MSKTSGQIVESSRCQEAGTSASQEAMSYGYQQVQGTERGDAASVATKKQQLIDAFEQFVDALVGNYQPGGSGGQAGVGTSGGGTGSGSTGSGSTDSQGAGGQSSYEGVSSTGSDYVAQQGGETFYSSIEEQREIFRQELAQEEARASESARVTPTSTPTDMDISNNHMSDSSKTPLQDLQEFEPAYGEYPRHGPILDSPVPTIELMSGENIRPETVPATPLIFGPPLDAYWASFGTAKERAEERAKLFTEKSKSAAEAYQVQCSELIIGEDDRVLVANNEAYPWRCICSLRITARNGRQYIGTGWLVGARLLLTAGHCVYLHNEGGWASEITVIPGRNGAAQPFGTATTSNFRSVRGWTRDQNRDHDYGAILLDEDHRLGDQVGWFGFATRSDDHFSGITLNLSGYPGDGGKAGPQRQQGTQWFNSRRVKNVNENQITYEIDTWGGQSGAPVWEMTSDGTRYGLAIHAWGTTHSNGGTRITRDVFDNIVQWTSEVP